MLGDDAIGASFEAARRSRYSGARGRDFALEPFVFLDYAKGWIDDNGLGPDPRDVLTAGGGVRARWGDRLDFGADTGRAAAAGRLPGRAERSALLFTSPTRLLPWGDH